MIVARSWFGGTHLDLVVRPFPFGSHRLADLAAGQKVTFHDAETGGNQITDLLDDTGTAVNSITTDADGYLPRFQGPDSVTTLYADAGFGRRFLTITTDGAIDLSTQLSTRIPTSEKGAPDGVATLDGSGRLVEAVDGSKIDTGTIPEARIPADLPYVEPGDLVVNVKDHGAVGDGTTDDTAAIQAALDLAVGTLLFPPGTYKVTGTGDAALTLTRNVNLVGQNPRQTLIRGDALGATTDVLRIAITDNGGNTDVRNWGLSGLRVLANASGRHAVYIANDTDTFPILTSRITNNNLRGFADNGGYSLYVDNNLAHCEVSHNTIQTGIYAKCRDANVFRKNLGFGATTFITFDVIFGVHNNTVSDNTIVTTAGAVHIVNGDTVRVVNNQLEQQGLNTLAVSAHVYIEGRDRVAYNTVVENNNLGGGTNVDHLIYVDNAQKSVITKNQFVACNVAEVYLTANAKYNVLRRDNYTRGTVSNPRTRTAFKEEVVDLGLGNAGVRKDSSDLALQNGWTGGEFFKDDNGTVHFTDVLSGGSTGSGIVIGTIPDGFRPLVNWRVVVAASGGSAVLLIAAGTGNITIDTSLPSNAGVSIPGFPAATDAA